MESLIIISILFFILTVIIKLGLKIIQEFNNLKDQVGNLLIQNKNISELIQSKEENISELIQSKEENIKSFITLSINDLRQHPFRKR